MGTNIDVFYNDLPSIYPADDTFQTNFFTILATCGRDTRKAFTCRQARQEFR